MQQLQYKYPSWKGEIFWGTVGVLSFVAWAIALLAQNKTNALVFFVWMFFNMGASALLLDGIPNFLNRKRRMHLHESAHKGPISSIIDTSYWAFDDDCTDPYCIYCVN